MQNNRTLIILLASLAFACTSFAQQTKNCDACGGFGRVFGTDIDCRACNGSGRVPLSAAEVQRNAREVERYGNAANDLMEQYNLSPEEYFAYEELIKQAMQKVPVYQNCSACGGSGNCSACGGVMNVSLDGPLCNICGGAGSCIACNGQGQIKIGEQDNPNKEQLVQRAKEILNHGEQRREEGRDAFGNVNNPGTYNDPGTISYLGESPEGSSQRDKSPITIFLFGILGFAGIGVCCVLVWLAIRLLKK